MEEQSSSVQERSSNIPPGTMELWKATDARARNFDRGALRCVLSTCLREASLPVVPRGAGSSGPATVSTLPCTAGPA